MSGPAGWVDPVPGRSRRGQEAAGVFENWSGAIPCTSMPSASSWSPGPVDRPTCDGPEIGSGMLWASDAPPGAVGPAFWDGKTGMPDGLVALPGLRPTRPPPRSGAGRHDLRDERRSRRGWHGRSQRPEVAAARPRPALPPSTAAARRSPGRRWTCYSRMHCARRIVSLSASDFSFSRRFDLRHLSIDAGELGFDPSSQTIAVHRSTARLAVPCRTQANRPMTRWHSSSNHVSAFCCQEIASCHQTTSYRFRFAATQEPAPARLDHQHITPETVAPSKDDVVP